jgi:hypothetical protein
MAVLDDVMAGETLARAGAPMPAAGRHGLKRRAFEFFNHGGGSRIAARAIDLHFRWWKLRHPGATFADYYAGSIADELRRGKSHKTLGDKQFLSGSLASNPVNLEKAAHHARGTEYFGLALRHGLKRHHACIDYGCGSLRIGQHLIAWLDAGNYCGLDMVSDFYESGKTLLADGLLVHRQPRFGVIGPEGFAMARQPEPDFIFSFAVMKHVPPPELHAYFRNIAALMAPATRTVITFNEAAHSTRSGAKIWDYCQDDIIAGLRCADPALACAFDAFIADGGDTLPRTSVLVVRKTA